MSVGYSEWLSAFDNFKSRQSSDFYKEDAMRIVDVVRRELGIPIGLLEAIEVWRWYSSSYEAGWLGVDSDSDEEIVEAFHRFVRKFGMKKEE